MTGNNKFWRASLAGLASVAMLATMGVAASTASAATEDQAKVEFEGSGTSITGYKGQTLADLVGGYGVNGKVWTLDGTTPVDWSTVITEDVTLTELKSYNYSSPAGAVDGAVVIDLYALAAYEQLPGGSSFKVQQGTKELSKNVLPVDKGGDHQLVTEYKVTPAKGDSFTVSSLSDPKFLQVAAGDPGAFVTVTASKVDGQDKVRELTIKGDNSKGYVVGARADGTADDDLTVDVPNKGSYTIPAWFAYPQSGSAPVYTDPTWTRDRDDEGTEYKVGDAVKMNNVNDRLLSLTGDFTESWVVRFYDGNKLIDSQRFDKSNKENYAKLPAAPSKDGFSFKGWRNGSLLVDSQDQLDQFNIQSNVNFYAQWYNKTTQVKVTFRDVTYNGHQADVVKYFDGGSFLNSSDAPAWTRSGYVLAGWTLNGKDYEFGQQFTDTTDDFILVANWTKVESDIVPAALSYIPAETNEYASNDSDAEIKDYKAEFTAESWKSYAASYETVLKEYKQAKYTAPASGISAETSAKLVSELKAAWEQLVFAHDGGSDVTLSGQAVHRLYSPSLNEHFYSATRDEILALTTKLTTAGGWDDEGVLFYTAEKGTDKAPSVGDKLVSFSGATAALKDVATPILKSYARFYSPTTGDHVWTLVGGEEYKTLAADAAWNNEGVAYYTPTFTGSTDVVRFYNPGLNRHLLSVDPAEQAQLVKDGWNREGVSAKGI